MSCKSGGVLCGPAISGTCFDTLCSLCESCERSGLNSHAEGARLANGRAEVATHCCRVKLLLARHTTWPRCLRSPIGLDDGKVNAQEEFGSMESAS